MKAHFLVTILFLILGAAQLALAKSEHQQQIIQNSSGTAINALGSVDLTIIQQSPDYKSLNEAVDKAKRNVEKLPNDQEFIREYQQAERNLAGFIEGVRKLLADIDKISLNSERGKKAKEHFEKGDYQAARSMLDAKEMGEEKQALFKKRAQVKKQEEENKAQLEDLAADYILKAELTALDYSLGGKRVSSTKQCFKEALDISRTPGNLFSYANFLSNHNEPSESEKLYQETLKISRELAESNPQIYLPNVAKVLATLGKLVTKDISRHEEAEVFLREALKIYLELVNNKNNPGLYLTEAANTVGSLGSLVSHYHNRREEAEKLYEAAILSYRKLAEDNPDMEIFKHLEAAALNNLAILVRNDHRRYAEAETHYRKAIEIYVQLKGDPDEYLDELMLIGRNLSVLPSIGGKEKENLQQMILKHYRDQAKNNPEKYLPELSSSLSALADTLGEDNSRRKEAEELHREALLIYIELALTYPFIYGKDVAALQRNLGNFIRNDKDRKNEAEEFYQKALFLFRQLAKLNSNVYLHEVALTLRELALLIEDNNDRRNETEKFYQEALTIHRNLEKSKPTVYLPAMANTLMLIGVINLNWQQSKKAQVFLQEAHELFNFLAKQHPKVYDNQLEMARKLLKQVH